VTTRRHRLAGLGASLAILLLMVGTPALLLALGATPWHQNLRHLGDLLTRPDDGTLALVVIAALAWIAWAVMAVSFLVEITAAVRGVSAPHLPAFGLPQHVAGHLVATAALLFIVAPTVAPMLAAPPAQAAPVADRPAVVVAPVAAAASPTPPVVSFVASPVVADDPGPATVEYQVRRGDSLWKIADEQLGDGTRYTEIVALNQDALHGRPDFIDPGLVLRLPGDAPTQATGQTPADDETYVVQQGDTLWDIARDTLDDPTRYPEIVDASRSTLQPDGAQLRDPDLIRPGWKLTIPGTGSPDSTATDPPTIDTPPVVGDPPVVQTPGTKHANSTPRVPTTTSKSPSVKESTPQHTQAPAAVVHDAEAEHDTEPAAGWLVPGLLGSGALLGGAVLIAVRAHRRTQQRYRVPGRAIAPPPDEVRAVEKTATSTGGPAAEGLEQLDQLLRHLAASVDQPSLAAGRSPCSVARIGPRVVGPARRTR
jgi:LysM repeat protein